MALEFHTITSKEFLRLGTHGELDWAESLNVVSTIVKSLIERGTDLVLADMRDTETSLTDEQILDLVLALKKLGQREYHRMAILHKVRPFPKAVPFVRFARQRGFDVAEFVSYEKAVEWLSRSDEKDPDFDRETYHGPEGQASPDAHPPPEDPA
jgi:hypothetical protein